MNSIRIFPLTLILVLGLSLSAAAQIAPLKGVTSIGLRMNVRYDEELALGRIDADYIQNLVRWQLDQYRVRVDQRTPNLPFLSVRVRAERVIGPAQLIEDSQPIEGVFKSVVAVEFYQQVSTILNPDDSFWSATYRRTRTDVAKSRQELQNNVIRGLERSLFGFIHSFRRANQIESDQSR